MHSPTTAPVIDGVGMRVAASIDKMGLPLTSRREFLVATGTTMTVAVACGLEPQFITAELTATAINPALAHLKPLAEQSLANALSTIDQLWSAAA
jgi:hypothetical protein